MGNIVPRSRPRGILKWGREAAMEVLQKDHGVRDAKRIVDASPVFVVGVRGYYEDEMGVKDQNDAGIYDDAKAIFWPGGAVSFNANVDPSKFGRSPTLRKLRAQLVDGLVYPYITGRHRDKPDHFRQPGHEAAAVLGLPDFFKKEDCRSVGEFPVIRTTADGVGEIDEGEFGINMHSGGDTTTSSLGCQTIYPSQWPEYQSTLNAKLALHGQKYPGTTKPDAFGRRVRTSSGWFAYYLIRRAA